MSTTTTIETGTTDLFCSFASGVVTLTMNRPEAKNALSAPMSKALAEQIKKANENPAVRVILLTGAGGAFCAGGDVKTMGDRRPTDASPEQRLKDLKARHHSVGGQIVASPKPTIAAVAGPAVGAGLAIALSCDIRVAADTAFFGSGYSKIGLSGDYGVSWLLTRTIGTARAREMLFTSDRVDAVRAERIGLVNRVVPAGELAAAAHALAVQIAEGPAGAIRSIKQNLDEVATIDHPTAIDREAERIAALWTSEDHKEAVRAFVDKRKPVFNRG